MRKSIIILFILLNILWPNLSYGIEDSYRVAGDSQFPPYEYIDAEGVYKGFNVDMLKAISLVTELEFEFLPMKWEDAYYSIGRGQADIIQGMKESEERKGKFLFSDSLLLNSQSIFVLDNNANINNEMDLEGRTISLLKEDISYNEIRRKYNVEIIEYESLDGALEALLNSEVDALIGNTLTVNYLSKERNSIELIKIIGDTLNEQRYCIAVDKNNEILIEKLNAGIAEIQKSGMYDSLYRKWFGAPIKNAKTQYETLWKVTIVIALGLLTLVLVIQSFNRKLKNIVDIKTEEQKVLINELRRYDKLQFMDKIISSIAHEIRNPLTSIKLYSTQMKYKLKDEEFILAASEDIPDEIDRIDGLIKEFMEYSSPRKAIIESFPLYEELMKTLKLVKFHIGNVNLLIDVDKSYYIRFDLGHFKQIVLNILLNSINAVKEVDFPTIDIRATETEDLISLSLNDNGCGMGKDDIQYIFEPFYTTKEYGNGVGMFVVKQLVDENDGMISASSHGEEMGMSIILEFKKGECNEE